MLMMRLQRVGRRNDPSYRIVVTDKRTGPKSDKHVDRLGSYNPKMNQVQLDADKAKEYKAYHIILLKINFKKTKSHFSSRDIKMSCVSNSI